MRSHVAFCGPKGELPKGDDGSYGTSVTWAKAMDPSSDILIAYKQVGLQGVASGERSAARACVERRLRDVHGALTPPAWCASCPPPNHCTCRTAGG